MNSSGTGNLEARTAIVAMEEHAYGLLFMVTCFLTAPKDTNPVMELPVNGAFLSHVNLQLRKCPMDLLTVKSYAGIFSLRVPSPQMTLATKLSSTPSISIEMVSLIKSYISI